MCDIVYDINDEWLETPNELAAALNSPVEDLPCSPHYLSISPDSCLCQVDLEKIEAAGKIVRVPNGMWRLKT